LSDEEIKQEINHIFESGANEIRIFNLIKQLALSTLQVKEVSDEQIEDAFAKMINPSTSVGFVNGAKWFRDKYYVSTQMTSLPVSQNKELLNRFITEIKNEFKDQNWDYLDFIADRVLSKPITSQPVSENKESIKRLSKLAKAISDECTIDDDVTGGYMEDPEKSWVTELYEIIDKMESSSPVVDDKEDVIFPPKCKHENIDGSDGIFFCTKCGAGK